MRHLVIALFLTSLFLLSSRPERRPEESRLVRVKVRSLRADAWLHARPGDLCELRFPGQDDALGRLWPISSVGEAPEPFIAIWMPALDADVYEAAGARGLVRVRLRTPDPELPPMEMARLRKLFR